MKKVTFFLLIICLIATSNVYAQNYPITTDFWEGNSWCGNNNQGSWFPTVDSVAHFGISDICVGQIRTKDSIPLGTTLVFIARVFHTTAGVNGDGSFFGFTTGWESYAGNSFGIVFRDGKVIVFENPELKDTIGVYTPGTEISFSITLKTDGSIDVVSTNFNGHYVPVNDFAGRKCLVSNSNSLPDELWVKSVNVSNGLVAYYQFNANAVDSSGYENHGAANGGVSWVSDRFTSPLTAASFDGSLGYINVPLSNSLSIQNDITVCLWVKSSVTQSNRAIIEKYYGANNDHGWLLETYPDGDCMFEGRDGRGGANTIKSGPSGTFYDNQWHFLVGQRSGNDWKIYLDGTLANHNDVGGTSGSIESGGNLRIGASIAGTPTQFWNGAIDDIRIYNRALSINEIRDLYSNYRQQITSISDIPNDQGGKVRITWDRIYLDSTGLNPQITSYGIWRKIPSGMIASKKAPTGTILANDTLGTLYDYVATINAVQSPSYNYVAQTIYDSSETGDNSETFIVTAHTADPNVYYISDANIGYSVDNLSPAPPTSLTATNQLDASVELEWNAPAQENDFREYEVYRSAKSDVMGLKIYTTSETSYHDLTTVSGKLYFYRVIAVDIHDNKSASSPLASTGTQTTQQHNVLARWNMISVPLYVDDYSKSALYPTATSNAYSYQGGYVVQSVLQSGKGYWLKFGTSQSIPVTGYLANEDTFDVIQGWNMIGSISEAVATSGVVSVPGGITTSLFYGYPGSYVASATIEPGKGYWVKVSQSGKLVLSSSGGNISSRIRIVNDGEFPPSPPDGNRTMTTSSKPEDFTLNTNYPNPFNPSTTIRFGVPVRSFVKLEIFSTLGQKIVTLVDEQREAGYYDAEWNAQVASGLYFYRLEAIDFNDPSRVFREVKKMVLMK